MIDVTDADIANASPNDAQHCAIAEACVRLGARDAVIGSTFAYIVTEVDGEEVAIRFMVPHRTREQIKTFDKTGRMETSKLRLRKLKPSQTLARRRVRSAQAWQRKKTKQGVAYKRDTQTSPKPRQVRNTWRVINQHTHSE